MNAILNATTRTERGKGAARKLRSAGRVPAVVYGHGDENRSLTVDAHDLSLLLAAISVENTLVDLTVDEGEPTRVLIREVQAHPFKPEILHVDFLQIHAGEKIKLQIPVHLTGTAKGVRDQGGVLDVVVHDLDIECLPRDIPQAAEIDVSELEIGDVVRVADIRLPNVVILNEDDVVIAHVTHPTKVAAPAEEETEEGVGEIEEPELIRDRAEDAEDVPAAEQG